MKKKLFPFILSLILIVNAVLPEMGNVFAQEASYDYEKVNVTNPVSNSYHVTTGTTGDGGPDWAFDGNAATHWHSNYTADVTEDGQVVNTYIGNLTLGTVDPVPEYADVSQSRAWIGGEFEEAVQLGKFTYQSRTNKNANWIEQWALYTANVTEGTPADSDFTQAAAGTWNSQSQATVKLDVPVTATHFRLVVFTAHNGHATASEIQMYKAIPAETTPGFGGSIVDTDTHYTQDRFGEVKRLSKLSESLTSWKNDKAVSEIVLYAQNAAYENVTVTAGDLTDGNGNTIPKENVTTTFIKSTKAYNGSYLGYGSTTREVPADNGSNRSESPDILYQTTPLTMGANTVQPVWVEFAVPKDAAAGTYTGTVSVTADGLEDALTFTYSVKVYDAVLPDTTEFTDSFDIMLWQYPYSSAEYYGVEPFSAEHLAIMESGMEIYRAVGGNAITTTIVEEAWSGQTYSKNAVHYPSMIRWETTDGGQTFTYDYTDFDAWVTFCKGMGLGDKIVLYSIAPWHGSFTYWEGDTLRYEAYTVGSDRYNAVWTDFFEKLIVHLEEKGWFEDAYVGIDERGFDARAFDLIESIVNEDGVCLKTASDMDNFVNKWDMALRITDLNVGDTAAASNAARFAELLEAREAKGYRTTLYSCTEHQPGQFSLSAPVESYWAVLNAGRMGAAGFNRWAYDAWVEDPLNDATHNAFEPGDCFLVYPDESDADNPETRSSVRLERLAEGVRDVNKLRLMEKEIPALAGDVEAVYACIGSHLTTSRSYMTDSQAAELAGETALFKQKLDQLTEKYIAVKSGELDPAAEGQVSYYSFDDETAEDLWGDRDGIVNEGASFEKGKVGKALKATATGNVTFDKPSGIGENDSWTISYWVKNTGELDKRVSVLQSADNYAFSLRLDASANRSKGGYRVGNNDGDVLTFNYTFAKDTWYYIAWTQSKATGLTLYVDGERIQSNAWTKTNRAVAPLDMIGGTGFDGLIDEVKVYNKILTADEIAADMQIPGINVREQNVELYIDDTYEINATIISNEADRTITYTSSDNTVAAVSADGVITAKGLGKATITLTAAGGYEAVITVKVSKEISILNKLPLYILGEEYQSDVEGAASTEEGTLVGTNRVYLGQPDMVQTKTGRLITVFPTGHGHGPLIMKYSDDEGETWTEMENTPESWKDSQETPTVYSLDMEDGTERLVLICACPGTWGNYTTGWDFSYSDDNGETWTEFEHFWSSFSNGNRNDVIVGMASLVQLKDEDGNYLQKWMGVYHSGSFVNYKTYLTFDEDGNPEWTEPQAYLSQYRSIESSHQICEVGMFRSPDGERIVALARNQTHTGPATMFYSDDEGETWSEPVEIPGSLAGERHKAVYDPVSGRLLIAFREIDYDRNNNGVWEGGSDWTAGDWVAWVGTYEDLMNLEQGDYMIRLDEDFSANYYSGDCGYTGMAVLEDGTFILHSYGHWDEAFSKSYVDPSTGSYNVRTDLCWIRQAKFKLGAVENDEGLVDWSELEAKVAEVKDTESGKYTADTWSCFAAALKTAQEKIPAGESQQVQVNTMLAELTAAYEALEENKELPVKPENSDKEKAQKYYDECKAYYVEADYTKASWAAYKNAMEALKAVLAKDGATTAELQTAVKAVYDAAHKLVKAPVSIETPETPATPDKPVNASTPTTGDTANVLSFTVTMLACAMAVVILRKRLAE